MPELPDIVVYLEALERRVLGQTLTGVRIASPSVLRTFDPPYDAAAGQRVEGLRRVGKRLVFEFPDELFMVIHLMIAGRLRWSAPGASIPRKVGLAAMDFEEGTLVLTEQGTRKRAGLWVLKGEDALAAEDRGGIEPLEMTLEEMTEALQRENRTVKRALTDPRLFSGIGNAYSDEILWTRLSHHPHPVDDRRGARATPQGDPRLAERLDGEAAGRSGGGMARESDGVPSRHGGPRQVRRAVPPMRVPCAADRVRRQRDQLLRHLPNGRASFGGPLPVAAVEGRLAQVDRRARIGRLAHRTHVRYAGAMKLLQPGRITEMSGLTGMGMTRLGLGLLAEPSQRAPVVVLDVKGWLSPVAAWEMGVDSSRLVIVRRPDRSSGPRWRRR